MAEQAENKRNRRRPPRKGSSLWHDALRYLLRQRSAILGLVILGIMLVVAIFAPLIATHSPTLSMLDVPEEVEMGVRRRLPPCIHLLGCPEEQPQHILGLDSNVRDLFSRIVYGSRYSLYIGFASVGFAIVIGVLLGAVGGYLGGWVDNVIMRIMDVLLAFPTLLLAIAIVTVLGPGLVNALLAIGIVSIPAYARVMRASVISIKERDFVVADRALGASPGRILVRRILPNAITPMIVQGTLGIATAILDAAALSFLGLGAQPPTPEWGTMLGAERTQVFTSPHLVFFPGLMIMLVVLAFNLLGDGLRDALDPRLNR
ncbi:MAG: ABC transporter permease [Anaerolineae bacterium]|nr:ABC transporter permease [Anaerolineae bacterium]